MQVILRNPALNLLAAKELLELARIPGAGLSNVVREINNILISDIEQLGKLIQVSVTVTELPTKNADPDINMSTEEILNYYVRHGATRRMIRDHIGAIGNDELAKIRALVQPTASGKPKVIPNHQAIQILDAWALICGCGSPTPDKLIDLHRQFGEFTLASLFALINEA